MSERNRRLLSTLLTGLMGGVVALVLLALISLSPLAAIGSRLGAPLQQLPACLRPPAATIANCQSNEKTLGLALLQYTQDYDEKFPFGTQPSGTGTGISATGVGWAGEVYDYLKDPSSFTCPFDHTSAAKPVVAVSYALNVNLAGVVQPALPGASKTVALFEVGGDPVSVRSYDEGSAQGASIFSAAGDGTDGHLLSGRDGTLTSEPYYATGRIDGRPLLPTGSQFFGEFGRDDNGTNVLAADGHVAYLPQNSFAVSTGSTASSPTALETPGINGQAAGTDDTAGRYMLTFSPI